MEFTPLKSKRAREEVAAQIREMIVSGRLKPGDKLPAERELAERLGIGRHSLREALRSLEVGGLLETRRGKWGGTFVTAGNPQLVTRQMTDLLKMGNVSYASVIEARIVFGEVVVRVACARHSAEDIAALEANVTAAEQLFAQNKLLEKTEKNIEFHDLLARATKNPTLVIMMQTLTDMARYFARNIGPDPASSTVGSRRLFMKAFVKRDAAAAIQEMTRSLLQLQSVHTDLATRQLQPATAGAAAAKSLKAAKAPAKRPRS